MHGINRLIDGFKRLTKNIIQFISSSFQAIRKLELLMSGAISPV